jgi:hypothetical protein
MRRWAGAASLGVLVTVLLAGCSAPGGADGDLTDDWSGLPEPKSFVPAANVCHPTGGGPLYVSLTTYNPVDCGSSHEFETFHVGQFTGEHASRATTPEEGSPAMNAAFKECDAKAKEYLGADWRGARLSLGISVPTGQAWPGGSRWFRCDLIEAESIDSNEVTPRSGSLKDALKTASPLAYACFRPVFRGDDLQELTPIGCSKPHKAEFAGVWTAPETSFDDFDRNDERMHTGCRTVAGKFAGLPNDGNLIYRIGTISYSPSRDEWERGDRGVQCLLWMSDRNLTRSMKGAGTRAFPIQ